MTNRKPQKQLLQFVMLALLSVVSVVMTANESFAALQCYSCHGQGTTDIRPQDTPAGSLNSYRNITTGAVKGNHSEHVALTASAVYCVRCHYNQATSTSPVAYTSGHRDGQINFQANINSSPATGLYKGGVAFVNQTSVPTLGTCSNVNCHFETATPTWGADPAATTCDTCHASQPSSLSHSAHTAQYGGTASCAKCHGAKTTFQHATSAGNAGRNIDLSQLPAGSVYSGSNYQFLPSQSATRVAGQCSNVYCHSSGQSADGSSATPASYSSPVWGNAASGACGTCHGISTLNTGSHAKHIASNADCSTCHAGVGNNGATMTSPNHVDGQINVDYGTYNAGGAPGNGYGRCSTATCHNNGQLGGQQVTPTWGTAQTACTACHAASPTTGSHSKHLTGTSYHQPVCGDCHTGAVAGSTGGANHLNGSVNVAAGLGYNTTIAEHAAGNYTTGGSCSTTYCHSSGQSANGTSIVPVYQTPAPTWGGTVVCGTCHATTNLTTGSHTKHLAASTNCGSCHVGASATAYASTNHVNGSIDVDATLGYTAAGAPGNGYGTCSAASCHATTTAAPLVTPTWGTADNCTSCHASTAIATGSHAKHLSSTLTSAMSCGNCHAAAVANTNGGNHHIDGFVSVSTANGGHLSIAKHAVGTYTTNCSTSYCHGGGNPSSTDSILQKPLPAGASTAKTSPTWGAASMTCTSCHGDPPADTNHVSGTGYVGATSCNGCHSHVNADGLTFNTPALHLDGIIEGGNCNSCHGYPPVQSMVGLGTNANYSSAKLQNYSGGGGVHSVAGHLALTLKVSQNLKGSACLTCHPDPLTSGAHNQAGGAFLTSNVQVVVNPKYKFDKNRPIVYNAKQSGTGKTSGNCTNVACHFQKSPTWSTQTYTQGH